MLDAISSVVSAVAAQSVTAKDEAQTKNTNTASKKQDAKTDKSDAKTAGFSEEAAVYEKSDSKDDSKDTAKALSGGDKDKADELLNAFKKGFSQATGAWGDKLPSICQDTYDAVLKKFDDWKNGTEDTQVQG